MSVEIIEADYNNEQHMADVLNMLNVYSEDKMGQERAITKSEQMRIADGLREHPLFFSLLAYVDGAPAGVANCMIGFSTFAGKKLVNIHDLAVSPDYRGNGIGKKLMDAVEAKARKLDCCKVTLEVRDDNPARRLYLREGFGDDEPPLAFWHKKLT